MRVHSLLLGALGLLASTVTASPAENFDLDLEESHFENLAARSPCSPKGVHLIAASGDGRDNFHLYGLLGTLVGNVMYNIPKSTNVTLPYPKARDDQLRATAKGAHNLKRYIRKFHNRCPETDIVLVGYSAGAIITMNTICGSSWPWPAFSSIPAMEKVIAVIAYGDQTHAPGMSYNRGSCTGGGKFPRVTTGCEPFANKIRSYCDTPDPECCLGDDSNSHFEYPGLYDYDAVDFIMSKRKRQS